MYLLNRLTRDIGCKVCIRNFALHSPQPFPLLQDSINIESVNISSAKEKSQQLLNELKFINKICYNGGGEKGAEIHVKKNKKILPRDKLKHLFDEECDSLELSRQAGIGQEYGDIPGASTITIIGRINGRYCSVFASDGTLKGGTVFPVTLKKTIRAQHISRTHLLPSINLVDSGGAFLPLQAEIFPDRLHGGRSFYNQAVDGACGIPQLALICGSCTAGGAYQPSMCEDAGIVHKLGLMFLGGPPLVKAATGEDISAEDLGGATVHCNVSGGLDYFATTELEGFEMLRDFVATTDIDPIISSSVDATSTAFPIEDLNVLCGLDEIDKTQVMGIIGRIVDGSRFREFKSNYGQNLITGYSFIKNTCVGVFANSGPISYEDGLKGSHFAQICQHRNLPMIFLQNSGPLKKYVNELNSKSEQERSSLLRGRAVMTATISCATVPKLSFNIKSCHGDDNYSMCGFSFEPNFVFSWPGTEVTHSMNSQVTPYENEEEFSDKKKIKSASKFNFSPHSCWYYASRALYDGIIIPSETREVIGRCLRILQQTEQMKCRRYNAEFPVFRF